MNILPKSLQVTIDEFAKLPGVGPRTAERYAFGLYKAQNNNSDSLAVALQLLHSGIKQCPVTFMLIDSDQEISPLYESAIRNKQQIAVVEDPLDVVAIEKVGQFQGTYHVLGGALSPIDGIGPEQLHIEELLARLEADNVEEVIIATNASVEGESTALFLQRKLLPSKTRLTRLARGLPAGVDLEYADQITLARAFEGRQVI